MFNKITGKIDEKELELLAEEKEVGASHPVTIVIVATIAATYLAGACPTSACTKSCNK